MRRKVCISLYCLAVLLLAAVTGEVAASTTANAQLSVTANVATTCTIHMETMHDLSPVTAMNLVNGSNPVDVQCATGVTSQVTVGRGNDGQTLVATVAF